MSSMAMRQFLRALQEDDDFGKQCRQAQESGGLEAVVELAAARGWELTVEELAEAVNGDRELDDEALDAAAGGAGYQSSRWRTLSPKIIRGSTPKISRVRGMAGCGEEDEVGDDELGRR